MLTFHRLLAIINRPMNAPSERARPAAPGLFRNLGTALLLMRGLRRKSQGWVAREAGIGKSQLSKYETRKELPKLDSLGKVLDVLAVGPLEFFYTLHFIDQRSAAAVLAGPAAAPAPPGG